MGRPKSGGSAKAKAKKKCCRSTPRCRRCPLVLHEVSQAELVGVRDEALRKVSKRARKT